MDEDEIDRREALIATTMDDIWAIVEMLAASDGELTDEAQSAFEDVRTQLCEGLSVKEDDVIRRET